MDLGLGTQLPLMFGAQATVEFPYRVLAQVEVGWLPQPYVAVIDGFLVAIAAYDDTTSDLIRSALGDSAVLRLSAGWRPFEAHGFELLGGYTLAALGGGLSAREALAVATGRPAESFGEGREIPLGSTLHSFHVGVGWRWVLADHWVLRTSLQYLQCVASSSSLGDDPRGPRAGAALEEAERAADEYLDPIYTTYVKTPIIGLTLSYRL